MGADNLFFCGHRATSTQTRFREQVCWSDAYPWNSTRNSVEKWDFPPPHAGLSPSLKYLIISPSDALVLLHGRAKLSSMQVFRRGVGGVPGLSLTALAQRYGCSCVCIATSCFQCSLRIPVLEYQAILSRRYLLLGGSGTEPNESTKLDTVYRDAGVSHSSHKIHRPRFKQPTFR